MICFFYSRYFRAQLALLDFIAGPKIARQWYVPREPTHRACLLSVWIVHTARSVWIQLVPRKTVQQATTVLRFVVYTT